MIKTYTIPVHLKKDSKFEFCEGKLILTVLSSNAYESKVQLTPTELFTLEDLSENVHFRAYFGPEDLASSKKKASTRKRKEDPKKEPEILEVREIKKEVEPLQIKEKVPELPKLSIPSFRLPTPLKG